MASLKLCAEMDKRVLPLDIVYEIMLHLPAKALCRMRAVCRPWRSLLSNPLFIASHAARHPGPHLIASYVDNTKHDIIFSIMDLSGQVIKQVRRKQGDEIMDMASDVIFIKTVHNGTYRLVNAATGAVYHLPDRQLAQEHVAQGLKLRDLYGPVHMFDLVARKGLYKVLRMLARPGPFIDGTLFEIYTLNGYRRARWTAKQAPPLPVLWNEWAVVDGVVYLFSKEAYHDFVWNRQVIKQDWIVSFDLDTEEWRPIIRGPSSLIVGAAAVEMFDRHQSLALTNLNGSLVIVHDLGPSVDMWFLMDSEEGLWVKQCSVQVDPYQHSPLNVHPLLVLDDGRIVIFIRSMRLLQIHDPRNNTFTGVVNLSHCYGVSIYTRSLLSLDGQS